MSKRRGLVISCPIEIQPGGSLYMKSATLDPQELRFSLLFWDILDYPQNNFIHISGGPDEEFLQSAGVLQRSQVRFAGGGMGGDIFRDCHVSAFKSLDAAAPGTWSLATGERSISFLDQELEVGRGVFVKLHRAISIPDHDVALHDILEFRDKRSDELMALRTNLEDIYQRIVNAGDGDLSLDSELKKLDQALVAHLKSSQEWGVKLKWVSFEASLNLIGGVVGTGMGMAAGLSLTEAAIAGFAASTASKGGPAITLNLGSALRGSSTTGTPYRYISQFHDELFP